MKIKYLSVPLDEKLYWKYKNKCNFYTINAAEAVANFIERFVIGEFNKDFDIPEDDYYTQFYKLSEEKLSDKYDKKDLIDESK